MEIKQEKEEGKGGGDVTVGEVGEVEAQTTRDEEPEKGGRYSRLSVWLMVLYSALAIGSDG